MIGLTQRQNELYRFIEAYWAEHDMPPCLEEMREAMGFASKSGVSRILDGLEERGVIRRLPNRARGIEIIHRPEIGLMLDLVKELRSVGSVDCPVSGASAMTWILLSFLAGVVCGVVPTIAYARRQIVKIKRDDLSYQLAPTIDHRSVECRIRFAEGAQ